MKKKPPDAVVEADIDELPVFEESAGSREDENEELVFED